LRKTRNLARTNTNNNNPPPNHFAAEANSLAVLLHKHTYTTTIQHTITWLPRRAAWPFANSLAAMHYTNTAAKHFSTSHYQNNFMKKRKNKTKHFSTFSDIFQHKR
jgi:hypothetical protein